MSDFIFSFLSALHKKQKQKTKAQDSTHMSIHKHTGKKSKAVKEVVAQTMKSQREWTIGTKHSEEPSSKKNFDIGNFKKIFTHDNDLNKH